MLPIRDLFLIVMSILPMDPEGSLIKQPSENLRAQQQKLASAFSNKRGNALAVSLTTAMLGMDPKMHPELKGKLVSPLIETFPVLPLEKQVV